jgi:AcrR family transcriptional regulator
MDIQPAGEDAKRVRVLERAVEIFLAYGFQRTTMDDIARAAEMSRPALYLLFRNKTDIYRAITGAMLDRTAVMAEEALARPGAIGERIEIMLEECLFAMMARFASSPHGAEIIDMKGSLAGDLVGAWRARLGALIETAIGQEAARAGVDLGAQGLSPRLLATVLLDGVEGMKTRLAPPDEMRVGTRAIIRLIELALAPRDI